MFASLRKRFTYANIIMTLAFVFVMSGGAYAASKYVITSTKQLSPKVLKALKGQAGPRGQQGLPGVTGPAGPQGAEGKAGAPGTAGKDGEPGKDGAPGKDGKEGSPWTAGGTLPSGKTLKGQWSVIANASEQFNSFGNSVSFSLPLVVAPTMYYIRKGEGENEPEAQWALAIKEGKCKGSVTEPEAAAGNLCVFASEEENSLREFEVEPGRFWKFPAVCNWENDTCAAEGPEAGSRFGFGIKAYAEGAGTVSASGTWAVTAK